MLISLLWLAAYGLLHAFVGLRRAPAFVRRVFLIIPPYLALLIAIGYWWEIRYWMPMLLILVPLLIAGGGYYLEGSEVRGADRRVGNETG